MHYATTDKVAVRIGTKFSGEHDKTDMNQGLKS